MAKRRNHRRTFRFRFDRWLSSLDPVSIAEMAAIVIVAGGIAGFAIGNFFFG